VTDFDFIGCTESVNVMIVNRKTFEDWETSCRSKSNWMELALIDL